MPAVARNPAITAMEIATLCQPRAGPVRGGYRARRAGVDGADRRPNAVTARDPRRDDHGREAAARRRRGHVLRSRGDPRRRARRSAATVGPTGASPGCSRRRSLALAGRVADGVILVEGAGPTYVELGTRSRRPARRASMVVTFTMMSIADDRRAAYEPVAPFVAGLISERRPAFTVLPFFDEMAARVEAGGDQAHSSTCRPTTGPRSVRSAPWTTRSPTSPLWRRQVLEHQRVPG